MARRVPRQRGTGVYDKPPLEHADLVARMQNRGLIITSGITNCGKRSRLSCCSTSDDRLNPGRVGSLGSRLGRAQGTVSSGNVHFGVFGYHGVMAEITVTDARARLADVVDQARVRHDPVYLTRRGQRIAAVIDAVDLQRLIEAAENLADIEAARAARAEVEVEGTIPWDEVKADLGIE